MQKIKMTTPLVEMDGDEMTRILWQMIKDELLLPYIDLKTEYYDLGLKYRNETNDQVTFDSAEATIKYGVAVKCATITPNAARMSEYNLKKLWKSPNVTIRAILDGTVFRAPIVVNGIDPMVKCWQGPITIARHAYGDVYKNTEFIIAGAGKAELVFTAADGTVIRETIHDFDGPGILQSIHNTEKSIRSFAKACFNYALDTRQDLWFATKDTISQKYDHTFKDIVQEIFEKEYRERFAAAGIAYFYTLIDDAVARVMRDKGGFIWACKNYDGDVMSDMVSSAFGSLAMMTSVLVSPAGAYEYEAAHGTVQRHYYQHLEGKETSTNSVATIFAWTGALRKRGELDGLTGLVNFADALEKSTLATIESGKMTKDLALITTIKNAEILNSHDFIKAIHIPTNRRAGAMAAKQTYPRRPNKLLPIPHKKRITDIQAFHIHWRGASILPRC
jgi:isocitrate dehydrogenase